MTRRDPAQGRLDGVGGDAGAPAVARVRRYVDRQLRASRATGALVPVDEGLVGLAMTLADVVDAEVVRPDRSAFVIARLAAELRPLLVELRGERHDTDGDADYDAELAALVAAIRDAERSGTADAGARDPGPPDAAAP